VCFELEEIRQKSSIDFRTLLAVHEAGHGLVYGLARLRKSASIWPLMLAAITAMYVTKPIRGESGSI
jgi:hypothetical protein